MPSDLNHGSARHDVLKQPVRSSPMFAGFEQSWFYALEMDLAHPHCCVAVSLYSPIRNPADCAVARSSLERRVAIAIVRRRTDVRRWRARAPPRPSAPASVSPRSAQPRLAPPPNQGGGGQSSSRPPPSPPSSQRLPPQSPALTSVRSPIGEPSLHPCPLAHIDVTQLNRCPNHAWRRVTFCFELVSTSTFIFPSMGPIWSTA